MLRRTKEENLRKNREGEKMNVELIGNIWIGITGFVSGHFVESNSFNYFRMLQINRLNPQCFTDGTLRHMYLFPYLILLYSISIILFTLLFVLLCILTRYLATRYLNHPSKILLRVGFNSIFIFNDIIQARVMIGFGPGF